MSPFSKSNHRSKPASLSLSSSGSTHSAYTSISSFSSPSSSVCSPSSSHSRQDTEESIQSTLHPPSVDSGYASSSESRGYLSPHPDYMLSRTYENWKIADAATQRLFVDLKSLEECKEQLRRANKRRVQEPKSPNPKRKPSLLTMPFRKRPVEQPPVTLPPRSPSPTRDDLPTVEHLQAQIDILTKRIEATQSASERLDACFEELRKVLDDGRPTSWRSFTSSSSEDGYPSGHNFADDYTRARRTVAARDQAYSDSKAMTAAMQHACHAIQSAHHHYRQAMDLLDAVCSPNKHRWEAVMGDEQSRQETYREAADWAQKAQICFNECVRSLTPHWELLKQDELQDCKDIEQTGLLQAVQLYNLMYGGKVLQMGITQQVQVMIQKQDAMFERLTNFAVWVQNCTQECSVVELEGREKRDAARRHLVELWVKADKENENFSLVAPSMSVHVGSGNAY
ncbi:hypothetical protein DICSQDRAFT_177063 [Dichomitus squalens LYAD-421 SS1]|uniref:uncharacterized protein n=1 Tax=Dichomitus squalens (strain LYAD-421) TaxID=732165 RepID=UPI0004412347|nr:uncharacterized protein DICSQDRAFT_177063 [Dichomitus squalens LYAD-421 SS1]EJF67450.1 hypothetical protein DICSQDRAFT_177063 [Dichomitus squalens LYAD-421 SS1]